MCLKVKKAFKLQLLIIQLYRFATHRKIKLTTEFKLNSALKHSSSIFVKSFDLNIKRKIIQYRESLSTSFSILNFRIILLIGALE